MTYKRPIERPSPAVNGRALTDDLWPARILDALAKAAILRARSPWWLAFGVGVLAVDVGVLARLALLGGSTPRLPYITFFPAVAVAALIGGLRGGIIATILSTLVAHTFFIPLADSVDWLGLWGYLASAAMVVAITELLNRAQTRALLAEAARKSDERYRLLMEAAPSMVFECDRRGQRAIVSDRWCGYTGIAMEGAVGDGWLAAEAPDKAETTKQRWSDAIRAGQRCEIRHQVRAADGSYRWFLLRALPQRDADGDVTHWAGSCTDIDDLIRAETRLREADRHKDEFLAILAHELRNPLTPIRNAAHILRRINRPEPLVEAARGMIDRQVTHLVRLVDDLLDATRISRGKLLLQIERVDLVRICRETVEDFRDSLSEQGLLLTADIPAGSVWVNGDPIRLAQMLHNLLHNAQKFTDRGGSIVVKLGVEPSETGEDRAMLSVRDTGIGIDPEMLPLVFEVFRQADRALDRSKGGLGLGLALVKGLAEQHGGGAEVESAGFGRGTEFRIRLPLAEPAAECVAAEPGRTGAPPSSGGGLVLLVEDNSSVAESLGMVLELEGRPIEVAGTGEAAIAAARALRPQVMLCDIGLPDMSGYDVARALRSDPATAHIYLVALTGYGSEKDRQAAHDAGFDQHLTKPVKPERLMSLLIEADTKASALPA